MTGTDRVNADSAPLELPDERETGRNLFFQGARPARRLLWEEQVDHANPDRQGRKIEIVERGGGSRVVVFLLFDAHILLLRLAWKYVQTNEPVRLRLLVFRRNVEEVKPDAGNRRYRVATRISVRHVDAHNGPPNGVIWKQEEQTFHKNAQIFLFQRPLSRYVQRKECPVPENLLPTPPVGYQP